MEDVTLQVSEAIELINQTLDAAYPFIVVEGEVASFKVNQGKFAFFDVKDKTGSLGCFVMAFQLKFPIADGMKVRVLAQPKLTAWGKFSLTVREVMPVGEGSLKKSLEILQAKLEAEGLFDDARKRPLPAVPHTIGVVSSSQAAGYLDFIKILQNRWGGLQITLVDVPVQGIEAPAQLIGAIEHLNEQATPFDVIAVLRGGGSADDLSAFNHEGVVRAIAASRAPVITGIGHEVDVSLSDLAADRRAATPSNAAELLVPDKVQILAGVHRVVSTAQNGLEAALQVFDADRLTVEEQLKIALDTFFVRQSERVTAMRRTIAQLDPAKVLKRSYSVVRKGQNVVLKTSDVIIGDELTIRLQDGTIGAQVTNVKH